ncbi:MAG: hypothetical protein ACREP8_15995, partial [Candidatus Binatia bacterium]
MKTGLKNLLRGLGVLLLLCLLLAGAWVGTNQWPVPGPPELFPASELAIAEIPTNSLWLQKARVDELIPDSP